MAVLAPECDLAAQIVTVAALAVHDLTKDSLTDHVQYEQLIAPIAAVLHHHAWNACFLISVYQPPAVFHTVCTADLHGSIDSGTH